MEQKDIRHSAVVLVRSTEGILLLNRVIEPGGYCLPGGKVDPGEEIVEAAMRELREETGIVAELNPEESYLGSVQSAVRPYLVHVFDLPVESTPEVTLNLSEHKWFVWSTSWNGLPLAGRTGKMIELSKKGQWDNHPREDLSGISMMKRLGWKAVFDSKDVHHKRTTKKNPPAFAVTFERDGKRAWQTRHGWTCAELADGTFQGHRGYMSLRHLGVNESLYIEYNKETKI